MFWKSSSPQSSPPDTDRSATEAALAHFRQADADAARDARARVVGADAQGRVVRIEHGSTRPPQRCWYRIGPDGTLLAELTLEQVAAYGETAWR